MINYQLSLIAFSTTRFVVTLAGASDEYAKNVTSDLEDEEEEPSPEEGGGDTRALQKSVLKRNSRYNNQAVEATVARQELVEQDEDEG